MRTTLALLIAGCSVIAQDWWFNQEFDVEPITTDFTGVAYVEGALVAWGNWGTIYSSNDGGTTWRRYRISDSVRVVGVCGLRERLVALSTRQWGAISDDGGRTWQRVPLEGGPFSQCVAIGERLYAIGSGAMWVYDREMRLLEQRQLQQDTAIGSMCAVGGKLLYSGGRGKVVLYDPSTRQEQLIDLQAQGYCVDCPVADRLFGSNTEYAYFLLNERLFWCNTQSGQVGDLGPITNVASQAFVARNRAVYVIWSQMMTTNRLDYYGPDSIYCNRIDRVTRQWVDLRRRGNDRFILGLDFNAACFTGGDTIIAVGQSSLIYRSPDAGGSWEMVSFFPSSNVSTVENIVQVSSRHLWGYAHPFLVIHSSDGGITWRSQKTYPSTMMRVPWWSQYRYQMFQTSRGSVFLFLDSLHAMVVRGQFMLDDVGNMILTSDGGETFVPKEFETTKSPLLIMGTVHRGKYAVAETYCIGGLSCYSVFRLLDTKGDSVVYRWYSPQEMFTVLSVRDTLYALVWDTTLGYGMRALWRYDDTERAWHHVAPIRFPPVTKNDDGKQRPFHATNLLYRKGSFWLRGGGYFVEDSTSYDFIARFNPSVARLEYVHRVPTLLSSLAAIGDYIGTSEQWFRKYSDTSYWEIVYRITTDPDAEQPTWLNVRARRYFVTFFYVSQLQDSVWAWVLYDSLMNRRGWFLVRKKPSINPVELDPMVEERSVIWLSPPMPHPVGEKAKFLLLFDRRISPQLLKVEVYTLQGERLALPFLLQPTGDSSATLEVDVSSLKTGTYTVVISAGGRRAARAFVVVR